MLAKKHAELDNLRRMKGKFNEDFLQQKKSNTVAERYPSPTHAARKGIFAPPSKRPLGANFREGNNHGCRHETFSCSPTITKIDIPWHHYGV